jgi:hypothetical protein
MPPAKATRGAEKNSAGTKAYGLAPPFNGYGQRRTRVTRLSVDLQEGRLLRRPPVPLNALSRSSAVEGGHDDESSPPTQKNEQAECRRVARQAEIRGLVEAAGAGQAGSG